MTEKYTSYEILGVKRDASDKEIKAAYLRLVKQWHPDKGGTDSLFCLVENAKEELLDHDRRAELDRSLDNPVQLDNADDNGWWYFEEDDLNDEDYSYFSQETTGVTRQPNKPVSESHVAISGEWIERTISWIVWLVEAWLSRNTSDAPKSFVQAKKSPLPRKLRIIIWIIVVWLVLAAEYSSIFNLLSGGLDFAPIIFWNLIFVALFMLYRHHQKAEKSGGIR